MIDDDEPFEFANLSEEQTGVPGAIYITTQGRAPHVRWSERPGPDWPSVTISVEAAPRSLASHLPEVFAQLAAHRTGEWVKLNHAALVAFWEQGAYWPDRDVRTFIDALKRIP